MTSDEREIRKKEVKDRAALILAGMLDSETIPTRTSAERAVSASLDIEKIVEEKWGKFEEENL